MQAMTETTKPPKLSGDDPEFDAIVSAIRDFLRHEFAEHLYGTDDMPTKLSTYSAKGPGSYATADDGRADWSRDFKKYIFERTDNGAALVGEVPHGCH